MKNINSLKVGDSLESVKERLGLPSYINNINFNLTEYVYNYRLLILLVLFSDNMILTVRRIEKEK